MQWDQGFLKQLIFKNTKNEYEMIDCEVVMLYNNFLKIDNLIHISHLKSDLKLLLEVFLKVVKSYLIFP